MAHTCPDCGMLCHCGGDIDDIDFGDACKEADECTHCECPVCHNPREYCECGPPDPIEDDDLDN